MIAGVCYVTFAIRKHSILTAGLCNARHEKHRMVATLNGVSNFKNAFETKRRTPHFECGDATVWLRQSGL